jgi:hypothetical protein
MTGENDEPIEIIQPGETGKISGITNASENPMKVYPTSGKRGWEYWPRPSLREWFLSLPHEKRMAVIRAELRGEAALKWLRTPA